MIHIEDLALIKREALDDVLEGMRVDGLLKSLTKHVLTGFGVGDVLENGQYDVVAYKALGSTEEAEVTQDDLTLVGCELIGLPELDVTLHGDLVRHPVIGATFIVIIPGPSVFERHELVHINLLAVHQAFLIGIDPLGEVVEGGRF